MTGQRSRRLTAEDAGPGPLAGGVQRLAGRHRDVGEDAGAFPVAARDRAEGAGDRDGRLQVRPDPEPLHRVSATPGALADDGGPAPRRNP